MDILIVEPDTEFVARVCDFLEARGHTVDMAYDGRAGVDFALAHRYDAMMVRYGLPGLNGLEVCGRLRDAGSTLPILMLATRDQLQVKLDAFARGIDDFVVRPVAPEELEARLRTLYRRCHGQMHKPCLRVADLEFDLATFTVRRAGRYLDLPPTALKLLACLMRASPRVLSRAEIERQVWAGACPDSNALRVHMATLRRVLDQPFDLPLLHTVRGVGYRLAARRQDRDPDS